MSNFKAEMHRIRFQLGLAPYPTGRTYSAPPGILAGFQESHISKGRGEAEREKGEGRKG